MFFRKIYPDYILVCCFIFLPLNNIETCLIKSLRVRADYQPTRFSPSSLIHGNYGELLNAFVLEGAVISLNKLKLHAVRESLFFPCLKADVLSTKINGWGALFYTMQRMWLSQIINFQQMYDVVAGVKRVRPFVVLGGAAAEMVCFLTFLDDTPICLSVRSNVISSFNSTGEASRGTMQVRWTMVDGVTKRHILILFRFCESVPTIVTSIVQLSSIYLYL